MLYLFFEEKEEILNLKLKHQFNITGNYFEHIKPDEDSDTENIII
jgi:hypothetical protein